jgi:NADPH2:quinone reductase
LADRVLQRFQRRPIVGWLSLRAGALG